MYEHKYIYKSTCVFEIFRRIRHTRAYGTVRYGSENIENAELICLRVARVWPRMRSCLTSVRCKINLKKALKLKSLIGHEQRNEIQITKKKRIQKRNKRGCSRSCIRPPRICARFIKEYVPCVLHRHVAAGIYATLTLYVYTIHVRIAYINIHSNFVFLVTLSTSPHFFLISNFVIFNLF